MKAIRSLKSTRSAVCIIRCCSPSICALIDQPCRLPWISNMTCRPREVMWMPNQLAPWLGLQSCIIPRRRSPRVSGGASVVFGPADLSSPCWPAKWSHSALHAQMLRLQNWLIATGHCLRPRLSFCKLWSDRGSARGLKLRKSYFSLFCIYTPYTIYQCGCFTCICLAWK